MKKIKGKQMERPLSLAEHRKGRAEWLDSWRDQIRVEKRFRRALEYFKQCIDYPYSDLDKDMRDFSSPAGTDYFHIGYCRVQKVDKKKYPNKNFRAFRAYYQITEVMGLEVPNVEEHTAILKSRFFMRQSETKNGYHCLVWQVSTGAAEDAYHGVLLFPMKDGRYWIVSFWM